MVIAGLLADLYVIRASRRTVDCGRKNGERPNHSTSGLTFKNPHSAKVIIKLFCIPVTEYLPYLNVFFYIHGIKLFDLLEKKKWS